MTYDSTDRMTILFGGKSANSVYDDDTWAYRSDQASWTMLNPTGPRPPGRFGHSLAYVAGAHEVLMFGGATTAGPANDLWAFHPDTARWQELHPSGSAPPARLYPSLDYDPISNTAILFGGWTGTAAFDDTWVLDATANKWTELDTNPKPPARWGASLVYDPVTRELILFGGLYGSYDGTQRLNDTWAFDPSTRRWTQLVPATSPPARAYAAMSVEPGTGNIILFGGFAGPDGLLDDTWSYNPTAGTWTRLGTDPIPSRRDFSAMINDTTTNNANEFNLDDFLLDK